MKTEWKRLDNAAKIFPSASNESDTQVFRFSCELTEAVDPALLQQAVNEAVEEFRLYQCVMKRGVFWYYLESCDLLPVVREESKPLCDRIYRSNRNNLLFKVTYFKNKINLEFFHVLCDGTGAIHFLQLILVKYLSKMHGIPEPLTDYDASFSQMNDDSFNKYYSKEMPRQKETRKAACRLTGAKQPSFRREAVSGVMSVKAVSDAAHRYQTSITVFLAAVLMQSIRDTVSVRSLKKPVVLSIPVNLRKRFESETARNFFSIIMTGYPFAERSGEIEDLIRVINTDLKEHLTKERLYDVINSYTAMEHNFFARILPLPLKDLILKLAYDYSATKESAVISNLGQITMPDSMNAYIKAFYVYASTNGLQACICSFGDRLSVNFTSAFVSKEVQRRFFRALTADGIDVEIVTNISENGENDEIL